MKRFFRRHATLWMLIGFCLLLGLFLSLRTGIFFTGRNLINILEPIPLSYCLPSA